MRVFQLKINIEEMYIELILKGEIYPNGLFEFDYSDATSVSSAHIENNPLKQDYGRIKMNLGKFKCQSPCITKVGKWDIEYVLLPSDKEDELIIRPYDEKNSSNKGLTTSFVLNTIESERKQWNDILINLTISVLAGLVLFALDYLCYKRFK